MKWFDVARPAKPYYSKLLNLEKLIFIYLFQKLNTNKYPRTNIYINSYITYEVVFLGLTSSSTGKKLLNNSLDEIKNKSDFVVALTGNPNVR